jgi:hypothetical protein
VDTEPDPNTSEPSTSEDGFERRKLPGFGRKHLLTLVPIMPFSIWSFVMIITEPSWFWVGLFVLSCIIGLTPERLDSTRQRCPSCKAKLRRETAASGERIEFPCERCRVVWTTGFVEPSA